MRYFILLFALSLHSLLASANTVDSFLSSLREAFAQNDQKRVDALTYTVGMSDKDLALTRKSIETIVSKSQEIESISALPLPQNFRLTLIARGLKYEPTAKPVGLIEITFKPSNGNSASSKIPYAEVDNAFYLIGTKSTNLNWQGPPDKQIGFGLSGTGQNQAKIWVSWNASGVDVEDTFSSPSAVLIGQHINKVRITSDQSDSDLTLTVRENGQAIYTSQPLKGKGELEYKRE